MVLNKLIRSVVRILRTQGQNKTKRKKQRKQGIQGLQAFTFYIVTINDEHMKPGSNESLWVKLKATGTFVILLILDGFENDCPETKLQTVTSMSVQKQLYADVLKKR